MATHLILKCPVHRVIKCMKAIFNERNLTRLLWFITYLTSFVLFSYNLIGIYEKWLIDPNITVSIRNIPAHEVPFPAVTYCTPYVLSNNIVNFTDFQVRHLLNAKDFPNYTEKEKKVLASMIASCTILSDDFDRSSFGNQSGLNVLRVLKETSSAERVVEGFCVFEGARIQCSRLFNFVPTKQGLCYSFNMQGYNTIFNKGILAEDFDMFRRRKILKSLLNNKERVDDDNETVIWTLEVRIACN